MAATVVYARSRPRIAYVEEWASSTFSVAISIPQLLPAIRHQSRPPSLDRRAVTRHQDDAIRPPRARSPDSDQKLDAVATAIERVASLKQDYQQRIAAAAPSDKERIANEAINALAKAVTD